MEESIPMKGELIRKIMANQPFRKLGWGIMWALGAASAAYLTGFTKGCGFPF